MICSIYKRSHPIKWERCYVYLTPCPDEVLSFLSDIRFTTNGVFAGGCDLTEALQPAIASKQDSSNGYTVLF
ncbi:MAG: hypothetical protein RMZ41_032070 [Nostoc sp. DedVER02]|uniref:hypothetical protein n=1 Tax=unclassified Nostoc TaxID=2593658 RepID=UPI002AD1DED8|nr:MULTISPECIES: hypothetical protein [unclassified Nostoc]MDZ7986387.1 hypothetical protein [Nostoc sp. DedVER02]MDZ8116401.1 hypothetical protein [Nostoc sp. DedVER01b]